MDSLAKAVAATTDHEFGCHCMFCSRERKQLRDEAEADRKANIETGLPPVEIEAKSLYEMMRRTGETVDSIRQLISVSPRTRATLRSYTRFNPKARQGIERILRFRRRVAADLRG